MLTLGNKMYTRLRYSRTNSYCMRNLMHASLQAKSKIRTLSIFLYVLLGGSLLITGCNLSYLMKQQGWSNNYALLEEARATDPSMIDGNVNTGGRGEIRPGYSTLHRTSEAYVLLPQPKLVSQIILLSRELQEGRFKGKRCELHIYQDKEWKLIDFFTINGMETVIRFPAIKTEQVRLRLPTWTKFDSMDKVVNRINQDIITRKYYDFIPPEILEIEIYGPVETPTVHH
jgi:hypothetical protein